MADNIKYYVVKQKALPEVLLKVADRRQRQREICLCGRTDPEISREKQALYCDDGLF